MVGTEVVACTEAPAVTECCGPVQSGSLGTGSVFTPFRLRCFPLVPQRPRLYVIQNPDRKR